MQYVHVHKLQTRLFSICVCVCVRKISVCGHFPSLKLNLGQLHITARPVLLQPLAEDLQGLVSVASSPSLT